MPRITEHGLEVIDDPPARAHAITSDDDRRASGTLQVIDHLLMPAVAIHTNELTEVERIAPLRQSRPGLGIPVIVQVPVDTGNTLRQGRIEDDRQLRPIERLGPSSHS
ncbi:hypothetical protein D3C75_1125340 [compost metagenome]